MEHAIVLKPEVLGFYKSLPITNTLLVSWIVMAILIVLSLVYSHIGGGKVDYGFECRKKLRG